MRTLTLTVVDLAGPFALSQPLRVEQLREALSIEKVAAWLPRTIGQARASARAKR